MTPEERKEYDRQYSIRNKDQINENARERYAANPEKHREHFRQRYAATPERQKVSARRGVHCKFVNGMIDVRAEPRTTVMPPIT